MNRLEGKVALITGAARGIGRGVAVCLAEEGADIVLNDLKQDDAAQETADAIAQLGREVLICPADVSDRDAVAAMFA
jgi:NAD(P)-dependent dehydrogenase (short-subunit alcohol dehydrogenase family)